MATANAALRANCTPPRSRPIVAWSNTSDAPVRHTPAVNRAACPALPLMRPKCVLRWGEMTAKPRPSSAEPAAEASSAADTSRARSRRRGSSPMSTVPRPSMPIVPSRVMAEIAADP